MQGKFQTIGADPPISQLAGVIRGSASQGNSRNGSANTTPLVSPRGEQPSRRSSNSSASSTSFNTPQGTPPKVPLQMSRRDSKGSKDTTPVGTPRTSSHTSQPMPIPRRSRKTSDPSALEESSPTPPVRRESLHAINPLTNTKPSSFKSVTFAPEQLPRPTLTGSSPEPLQRRDSASMRDRILEKKKSTVENTFTIPDVISFAIFGQEYQALEDKQKIHEIIVLMEYLGYMSEELYMKQFKTRAEACTNLWYSMQNPIALTNREFMAKANGFRALLTPRIVIVDSDEDKLSELQENISDLLNNPNFSTSKINLIQAKISFKTKQLQDQINIEPDVFFQVSDFSQLKEKLLQDYPYNCFLIVATKRYRDGITTSHPQFSVYHPESDTSKAHSIENTKALASEFYLNKILDFLERNSLDNSPNTASTNEKSYS